MLFGTTGLRGPTSACRQADIPQAGPWMDVTGIEWSFQGPEGRAERLTRPTLDERGTFCTNNGIVAFVTRDLRMLIGSSLVENVEALKQAGYRQGSFLVPFSNGERPAEPELAALFRCICDLSEYELLCKRRTEVAEECAAVAAQRGIRPVAGGLWMCIDGLEYDYLGEKVKIRHPWSVNEVRNYNVGLYSTNNGGIAFIDHQGKMMLGPHTRQNMAFLEEAGYSRSHFLVHFSNGGEPLDPEFAREFISLFAAGKAISILESQEE